MGRGSLRLATHFLPFLSARGKDRLAALREQFKRLCERLSLVDSLRNDCVLVDVFQKLFVNEVAKLNAFNVLELAANHELADACLAILSFCLGFFVEYAINATAK